MFELDDMMVVKDNDTTHNGNGGLFMSTGYGVEPGYSDAFNKDGYRPGQGFGMIHTSPYLFRGGGIGRAYV